MFPCQFTDLGLCPYEKALRIQETLFNERVREKSMPAGERKVFSDQLFFCEHPHVYTLGKSGEQANLLIDMIQLKARNAEFFLTNRGGDITYHGPGQIVGYPVLDLEIRKLGVKQYVHLMEEAILLFLQEYGIRAGRLEGATGVWIDPQKTSARKICAIGIRSSRHITMHGFALNINTDLSYFSFINPCGFTDKGVTSLARETGTTVDFEQAKARLRTQLSRVLQLQF